MELYDLEEDLGETKNLAAARPDLTSELRRELQAWWREVGAEMMHPNPDHDPAARARKKGKKKDRQTRR